MRTHQRKSAFGEIARDGESPAEACRRLYHEWRKVRRRHRALFGASDVGPIGEFLGGWKAHRLPRSGKFSPYHGVFWDEKGDGGWKAFVCLPGVGTRPIPGRFDDDKEAALAREPVARRLGGRHNFAGGEAKGGGA